MTEKRYNPYTGTLEESLSVNGPATLSEDKIDISETLYHIVGYHFRADWEPSAPGEPIVDTETFPDPISESDVENALNTLRDSGKIRY